MSKISNRRGGDSQKTKVLKELRAKVVLLLAEELAKLDWDHYRMRLLEDEITKETIMTAPALSEYPEDVEAKLLLLETDYNDVFYIEVGFVLDEDEQGLPDYREDLN